MNREEIDIKGGECFKKVGNFPAQKKLAHLIPHSALYTTSLPVFFFTDVDEGSAVIGYEDCPMRG